MILFGTTLKVRLNSNGYPIHYEPVRGKAWCLVIPASMAVLAVFHICWVVISNFSS